MQKYQEKPIPLILREENGKYKVNQQAIDLFLTIQGKLAIISVAGIYRTGKSFLLNTIILNIKNGFAVGPTVNPKTKGIWVWGKPLIFKNEQDEIINVLVLDTEGLGSTEQDINHDLRLFSITLLLSSAFLYNTVGAIDENAIDRLGVVLRLCEHLKSDNYNDFPDFYWILRDFSLALVDKNNAPLTTRGYLEHCLTNQTGDSQYRNKIRQSIKQAFQNRNCYTFVRPLMNEQSLQNLDKMKLEQLRPEFVEEVINFRKLIFGNLRIKCIKGRQLKGNMLAQLVNIYIDCINSDKLPVIQSGWQQLCLKQLHQVLFQIEEAVARRVRQIKERLPRTKKDLLKQQQLLMQQFQQIFSKRLKNNDKAKEYFKTVEQMITKQLKGVEEDMKIKNVSETQAFVKKQFESIEKRLKQAQFKNMGQLAKQFEMFYEYYRKKCPYKDEIQTGLQALLKKFSDSSLILFKTLQSKKQKEMQLIRFELSQLRKDHLKKQEQWKEEKQKLKDKIIKLETNTQEIKKQSNELVRLIEDLQGKLNIAQNINSNNNNLEEECVRENLELKKKIINIEDEFNEKVFLLENEINTLKQDILLKNNLIENLEISKGELSSKIQQIDLLYTNCRQLSNQKIYELTVQLQQVLIRYSSSEKNLKCLVEQRDQTIDELERTLEQKNVQISQIINKNSQQNSMLTEMMLQEQRKCLQEKQTEIQELQSELQETKQAKEKKIKNLEHELAQKETEFRIKKMQLQQEKALLNQKIQFVQKQSLQKLEKNKSLQEEVKRYVEMIDEKDSYIDELQEEVEKLKYTNEEENEEIEKKIRELSQQLEAKNLLLKGCQTKIQAEEAKMHKQIDEKVKLAEELRKQIKAKEDQIKEKDQIITGLSEKIDELNTNMEESIQNLKSQNLLYMEEQKKNAQLSLVQLKNFYEMDKQRLEKRILQERKKYQYNEANTTLQLKNKYSKEMKSLSEQKNELNQKLQDLEEELRKVQNEYEVRIIGLEEDLQSEKRLNENRLQIMKRKYQQAVQDLQKSQKQHEQDRISFVKRIQGLNFEISKKQKQIVQLNVKRESLENAVNKKDSQLQNIKKTMHQQIQSSLKKVSEVQSKYQKVNEEFSKYKIEAEKENALLNQRNQFLNLRIVQLGREKQIGSSKNLEKLQKNKIAELKEQVERQKSENMSLQAKMENLRKVEKESSCHYKKEINQLQKQNAFLKQKNELFESKVSEMELKLSQKTQIFKKEIDEMRIRYNTERLRLQGELDLLKQKSGNSEEQKKERIFKLQMEVALLNDKISNLEIQKQQNKKELEETEKRLQNALNQLKKQSEKDLNASQVKRNSVDKRYSNQLQLMKMSSKVRQQELEESNKKLREELKLLKDKNYEFQERLNRNQKILSQDKNLSEEIEKVKREKQLLIMTHRNQIQKETDQWKRKYGELQRKNRDLEKQNNNFAFVLEKEKARHNAQKQQISQKLKQMEDQLNWERKKASQPKNRVDTSKSKRFSMTASDVLGGWH